MAEKQLISLQDQYEVSTTMSFTTGVCVWFNKKRDRAGIYSMIHQGRFCSVVVVIVFFLSGCAKVGPNFLQPEVTVSPKWLETGDDRTRDGSVDYRNWWQAFNDRALDRLIERAYRENLSLGIAGVRVLEARAQLGIAVGELYPQNQQAFGSLEYNRLSQGSLQNAGFLESTGSTAAAASTPSFPLQYWQSQVGVMAS
jgi:outer membrane protein TolC